MVQLKNKTSKATHICTCEVNIQRLNGEPVEGWTSPREMRRLPGGRLKQESRKLEQQQAWGLGNPKLSCARRYIKQQEKLLDFPYINSASQMSGFQFEEN